MKPRIEVGNAKVFHGDCRDVLKTLPDNSVDSIVTDPPYELGFMGKAWDSTGIAYDVTVWQECLRVLKPGGHLVAFGGSRTYHRLGVAIEDAGFEIRDTIAWISSKTFPKSLNVSKAIDKKLGVERSVVGSSRGVGVSPKDNLHGGINRGAVGVKQISVDIPVTAAGSEEARHWEGWGTGLKQVVEPVVLARKPLHGTVAENTLAWGVGGMNIDATRIGYASEKDFESVRSGVENGFRQSQKGTSFMASDGEGRTVNAKGRWPANVILDEVSAGLLDEQSGVSKSPKPYTAEGYKDSSMFGVGGVNHGSEFGDTGGASRFFYVAKASKRDRNEGLEDGNAHPTVKPTALMRYLIKLVTPAEGVVLDPFTGSGSTGKAALLDGYQFIGAELTADYLPIIEGRLTWASQQKEQETLF